MPRTFPVLPVTGPALDFSKQSGYIILGWTFLNGRRTLFRHGPEVLPTIASASAGSTDEASFPTRRAGAQPLYLSLLTDEILAEARSRENNRVYNTPVMMLLMIFQRLQKEGCLESAVLELPGLPASLWPDPCKRLQPGQADLSSETGAYGKARRKLPLTVVEQFCDHAFAQLTASTNGSLPGIGRRAFLFDGTTIRTPHTKELKNLYPPTSNQEGESHWPLIKMLVAHDLVTGLGMRPVWGAVNGPEAVSEQRLFEQAVERLPDQAVVVADANFGVFSVAYAAGQRNHPVVVRMTPARAKSLLWQGTLRHGIDRRITWKPTKADRKSHPDLPADACIRGRLIVSQVQPSDDSAPFLLCLFTTLDDDKEQVVILYGQRWNVGVSSQGHIVQPMRDRPGPKDSGLVAREAPWRESKTAEPSDNMLGKECAQRTRLQRAVHAEVASLHESPVAETVDNARKQQELAETSPTRQLSPAGYQRRHGVKEDVETGEALGARRRNLVEEMPAITASGKCWHRRQGGGSGRSTADGRAAKRARRDGPGPVSIPSVKGRQG